MRYLLLLLTCFLAPQYLLSDPNPFAINFTEKEELTYEDYIEVQNQIREININPLINALYSECKEGSTTLDDYTGRCIKGTRQILIDPEKGFYPTKKLVQIGEGGDRCVVCCGPFNGKYPYYINTLVQGLEEQGFNGHLLYLIGGWPNPTGKEIKYVAVPYSFKIFLMVEAYKLGFTNVLWIDAACYPVREIESLFNHIIRNGALLNTRSTGSSDWKYIFPKTRALLKSLTGTDVLKAKYINTIVFGLKMDTPLAQDLISTYYEFAEMGTPFLSCFPEEWVLTSIIGKKQFKPWLKTKTTATGRNLSPSKMVLGGRKNREDSPEQMEKVRQKGVYFYHRKGR